MRRALASGADSCQRPMDFVLGEGIEPKEGMHLLDRGLRTISKYKCQSLVLKGLNKIHGKQELTIRLDQDAMLLAERRYRRSSVESCLLCQPGDGTRFIAFRPSHHNSGNFISDGEKILSELTMNFDLVDRGHNSRFASNQFFQVLDAIV